MAKPTKTVPKPAGKAAVKDHVDHPPLAPGVKYRRILLKLSGEALMGKQGFGIEAATLSQIADELIDVHSLGVEVGIVIGGGNIFRGLAASSRAWIAPEPTTWACWPRSSTRSRCRTRWRAAASRTRVLSALEMEQVAEPYIRRRAIRHLEKGRLVIFAAGTGNPLLLHRHGRLAARHGNRRRRSS